MNKLLAFNPKAKKLCFGVLLFLSPVIFIYLLLWVLPITIPLYGMEKKIIQSKISWLSPSIHYQSAYWQQGHIQFDSLSVKKSSNQSQLQISLGKLKISPSIWQLLHGQVQINSLHIPQIQVRFSSAAKKFQEIWQISNLKLSDLKLINQELKAQGMMDSIQLPKGIQLSNLHFDCQLDQKQSTIQILESQLFEGLFKGQIQIDYATKDSKTKLSGAIKQLDLSEANQWLLKQGKITGTANLNFDFKSNTFPFLSQIQGQGELKTDTLQVSSYSLQRIPWLVSMAPKLQKIQFNNLDAQFTLEPQKLRLISALGKTNFGSLGIQGQVSLPAQNLNLQIKLKSHKNANILTGPALLAAQKQGDYLLLPLHLGGNLKNPQITNLGQLIGGAISNLFGIF